MNISNPRQQSFAEELLSLSANFDSEATLAARSLHTTGREDFVACVAWITTCWPTQSRLPTDELEYM
jgi:hypothetical protein